MRKNLPITQRETVVPADQYLISKTDLQGKIHYINPIFEEISGFSREELIGSDHNIVRHPHMPPSVFREMWSTLKSGQPWEGIVKNRRKDGGFYWVYARAIPIIEKWPTYRLCLGACTSHPRANRRSQPSISVVPKQPFC